MSTKTTIKQAWEKRHDETDLAYSFFSSYLQLGPNRSLVKVVEENNKKKSYKTQLGIWSSKYAWVERAAEYDQYLIKKQLDNKEEAIEFAKGEMIGLLEESVEAVRQVLALPNYSESKEATSNAMAKLKAAETVFDRLGLVKHKEPYKKRTPDRNTYIQNIYKKIDNYAAELDETNEAE